MGTGLLLTHVIDRNPTLSPLGKPSPEPHSPSKTALCNGSTARVDSIAKLRKTAFQITSAILQRFLSPCSPDTPKWASKTSSGHKLPEAHLGKGRKHWNKEPQRPCECFPREPHVLALSLTLTTSQIRDDQVPRTLKLRLILSIAQKRKGCCHPHFADEDIETQRS